MALLRRIGSIKHRSPAPGTQSLPRRGGGLERERGLVRCLVTLLDDTVYTCDIEKHQNGRAVMDDVLQHLDILEKDYFGLAYRDDGVTKWVDLNKQLKRQFRGSHTLALEFRVKFYVTDPSRLQEEITRYHFYLQVKKDLMTNKLCCSFESAALLGSYIVQAELGNYDRRKHPTGYVSELRFVQTQTEELEERVAEHHSTLVGKSTSETEFLFLDYARRLDHYGVELYSAKDHHGVELGLGITPGGISVFRHQTVMTTFSWLQVQKITYRRKKFYIELRTVTGDVLQNVVGFHMETYEGCKQLWKNAIEYHAFFRMAEVRETHRRGLLRKSKYKFTGRTEQQALEANREVVRMRSNTVALHRTPSKKYTRRTPRRPTRASGEFSPPTSVSNSPGYTMTRKAVSLREDYRPKVVVRANGVRAHSEERDIEEEEDIFQPEVTISDDMTGQFSLVQTEHPVPLGLNFSRVNSGDGPTEYYDERNAAEEQAGQVCMDDLASEGLLLIRVKPDEGGRYGFNIKGGVDHKVPVIVTKVSPNSPGVLCNPPLEEGDQILYINGKSVGERTHEQVIGMIRASREAAPAELVLVVKPKDLSRINPTFGKVDLPNLDISDPGHVMRESLTDLKETLASGKALLQFDRLYRRKPGMAAIASKLPQNLVKNRYKDISAYDATRVQLMEGPDYVNANFVNIEIQTTGQINQYIAAQGPMQHTCTDFWQMVWEQRCALIVMLTEVMEGGKVRCCQYWPDLHSSREYGRFEVFTSSEQHDRITVTRQFKLRNNMTGEERQVMQMQYIDWPDHGIPGFESDFLRFVQGIRSSRERLEAPVIVHCSAGIGRTGVFILMETALCKMEVLEPIYPLEIARCMRDQRGMMVQTPIQYQFVCESILRAYEEDYVEIELPSQAARSPVTYPH